MQIFDKFLHFSPHEQISNVDTYNLSGLELTLISVGFFRECKNGRPQRLDSKPENEDSLVFYFDHN